MELTPKRTKSKYREKCKRFPIDLADYGIVLCINPKINNREKNSKHIIKEIFKFAKAKTEYPVDGSGLPLWEERGSSCRYFLIR